MQLPSPDTYRTAGLGIEGNLHACLDKIEKSISKNSDSMAVVFHGQAEHKWHI